MQVVADVPKGFAVPRASSSKLAFSRRLLRRFALSECRLVSGSRSVFTPPCVECLVLFSSSPFSVSTAKVVARGVTRCVCRFPCAPLGTCLKWLVARTCNSGNDCGECNGFMCCSFSGRTIVFVTCVVHLLVGLRSTFGSQPRCRSLGLSAAVRGHDSCYVATEPSPSSC